MGYLQAVTDFIYGYEPIFQGELFAQALNVQIYCAAVSQGPAVPNLSIDLGTV